MRILLINGSPRESNSNTLKLANAFLDGITGSIRCQVDVAPIRSLNIEHCTGCFGCWTKTPGKCVLRDDMENLTERYKKAELVVWSFPLYSYATPSKIKAFIDRLLPLKHPQIETAPDGRAHHPSRVDLSKQRHVLISTCGFHEKDRNYDPLRRQFDLLFGKHVVAILCPEGELFAIPQLAGRTTDYLARVRKAGGEYARAGGISRQTRLQIEELLFPEDVFLKMANAHWGDASSSGQAATEGHIVKDAQYRFLLQMAALYNPTAYTHDIVVEMAFIDTGNTFQLHMSAEDCGVLSEGFLPYSTRIETPFSLWVEMADGRINGAAALMEKRYRVLGDFSVLAKMSQYFPRGNTAPETEPSVGRITMLTLLLPWLALWIAAPLGALTGGVVGIGASAIVHLMGQWVVLNIYDRAGVFLVSLLAAGMLVIPNPDALTSFSYLLCGGMWLVSCLTAIPVTAYYSRVDHGGDAVLSNPLFIKTNKILTAAWAMTYFTMAAINLMLTRGAFPASAFLGIPILALLMRLFTTWFSRWYPAKFARG